MNLLPFLKSPKGHLLLFAAFVAAGAFAIFHGHAREQASAAQLSRVESPNEHPLRESITRVGQIFRPSGSATARQADPAPAGASAARDDERMRALAGHGRPEPKPHALPISLVSETGTPATAAELSSTYAPYGRLIPCETVVTLESSKLDTPVIGLVTEDVWHDGRLIIPAGTEVHGRAAIDRSRERIAATGKWVIVWRDGSPLNGTELVLNGIALEREKDDSAGDFGLRDGSAGLIGQVLKTDDWQEIKLFASTFLAGAATGLQQLQNQGTLAGLAQVPVASGRNAALQGTADVLNAYARQIQETIARDGFFVRVAAGHQFYLYVTETIDQAKGTRGNVANAELWRKDHAN